MSQGLAIALRVASTAIRLPPISSWLSTAYQLPGFIIGTQTGWLEDAFLRMLGISTGVNEATMYGGVGLKHVYEIVSNLTITALRQQAYLGLDIGYTALRDMFGAIIGTAVGEMLGNIYRMAIASRSVIHLPTPFDLIWLGEVLEDIDEDVLAFMIALSGTHPLVAATYIVQSLPWLYEMHVRELYDAVDRSVRIIEDSLLWDIETMDREARWWFAEGMRTYHRTITRVSHIVDHIIERGLSRLWDLRIAVTTVYQWYLVGVAKPTQVIKAFEKAKIEAEMTKRNAEEAISKIESAIASMNFETELDILQQTLARLFAERARLEQKRIAAVMSYPGFAEVTSKVINALDKSMLYKTRFEFDKAIQPPARFWEGVAITPPSGVKNIMCRVVAGEVIT